MWPSCYKGVVNGYEVQIPRRSSTHTSDKPPTKANYREAAQIANDLGNCDQRFGGRFYGSSVGFIGGNWTTTEESDKLDNRRLRSPRKARRSLEGFKPGAKIQSTTKN